MLKRPAPGEAYGRAELPFSDPDFVKQYPTLHQYLTLGLWAPGQLRTTSTLLMFVDNGALKICLNDRDNNRSAFFTGVTFDAAFKDMEDALSADRVDWKSKRASQFGSGQTPF